MSSTDLAKEPQLAPCQAQTQTGKNLYQSYPTSEPMEVKGLPFTGAPLSFLTPPGGGDYRHLNDRFGCCVATQGHSETHISAIELLFWALRHFIPVLKGIHIHVQMDKTSVVYSTNHQGSTRSNQSPKLAYELLQ